jgi:hypothetical protein
MYGRDLLCRAQSGESEKGVEGRISRVECCRPKGLPCGREKFVQSLEKIAGRVLQYRLNR